MPLVLEQMALPMIPEIARNVYRSAWQDLEDFDKVILITWNPKPRFYSYDMHGENDYNMQWRTMVDKLQWANRCCSRYAFVAEISDMGKLHMHGFLVVSDRVKYHKSFLPSLRVNGFIKISKASSHLWKTFKYHVKELSITSDYITDLQYVLTHENREEVHKELVLYKALIAHSYEKTIKKLNVMDMLFNNLDVDSEIEIL